MRRRAASRRAYPNEKRAPLPSTHFRHLHPLICRESEAVDERPHALFLTAAWKSLGSCQLGDAMEARPKQFRSNLRSRALPLKQLEELGKRESQLRWSCGLTEWHA